MAAAGLGDEIQCYICSKIYTDPVSLPCGHNFCQACIRDHLNEQDQSQFYTCPQCGKRFTNRPCLLRNTELSDKVERLQAARETSQVCCTYCINSSVPAVKTCVQCEVSLCTAHLAVHNMALKHDLIDATNSLHCIRCPVHTQLLTHYCHQDSACICTDCYVLGDHKGHPVNSLKEASRIKKEELRNDLQILESKREETNRTIKSLHESWTLEREKSTYIENQVISIVRNLKEQLEDLERNVLSEVFKQDSKILKYYSDLIANLEEKVKEQSRTMSNIEKMLRMTDPLSVLQQSGIDKATICKVEKECKKTPLNMELDTDLMLGNLSRSLAAILTYNFPTDVKYKYIKEEGATDPGRHEKTEQETDTMLDCKNPEDGEVPVCPVINGSTYRLGMNSAGLFRCEKTGIKFQVKNPLTIEYELDSWGNYMSQVHRNGYEIISPLFNIRTKVQPGEVLAVHLPHYLSAADCDVYKSYIKFIHYKQSKIVLESPTQINPYYLVLENPSFCSLGAIVEKFWMFLKGFYSSPGVVLIYVKKLTNKYLIHLYLVPADDSKVKKVIQKMKTRNGFHLLDKPGYITKVNPKKKYIVSGPQGSTIENQELQFLFIKPCPQYPYSAIRVANRETSIRLNITEQDSANNIWECQLEDDELESLPTPRNGQISGTSSSYAKIFVKKKYRMLCDRLPMLTPILLELRARGIINEDEEELLHFTSLRSEKNNKLLQMIKRKGAEDEFYKILKETDPRLMEDLEGTAVGEPMSQ